jgi:predicted transcriptional regulator
VLFKPRGSREENLSFEELNQLKCDMTKLRDDVEEHFEAINANTREIDIQNNFICEIDNRLTKMEEKMDELHFLLKQLVNRAKLSVELSKDEQRVFLILYTHDKFIKSSRICEKAFLDKDAVDDALAAMMDKGLPIERDMLCGEACYHMDNAFKLRQAKEEVIQIDSDVTSQYQNTLLKQFFES